MPSFRDLFRGRRRDAEESNTRNERARDEPSQGRRLLDAMRGILDRRPTRESFIESIRNVINPQTLRTNDGDRDHTMLDRLSQGIANVLQAPGRIRESFNSILARVRGEEDGPRAPDRQDFDQALERTIGESRNRMRTLARSIVEGNITVDEFRDGMVREIRQMHTMAGILGIGGAGNFSPRVAQILDRGISEQLSYLDRFANEIQDRLAAGEEIGNREVARAVQYAAAARVTASQSQRQYMDNEAETEGDMEERRVLGVAEHCPDCFIAGTPVLCKDGWRRIEDVEVGHQVMTLAGWREVMVTIRKRATELWLVAAGERMVVCTGNHPFKTASGEWVRADNLSTGQKVMIVENMPDVFDGQVTFPNRFDGIPLLDGEFRLDSVTFGVARLDRVERLVDSRVPMTAIHENNTPVDVYTLTIDEHHNYITNGFVNQNCIEYASWGWSELGSLPPIGDSQCGHNCRCNFEYRQVEGNNSPSQDR